MPKQYMSWYLTEATAEQKNLFLQVYSAELAVGVSTNTVPDLSPNTEEKISLWETYCTAVNIDPALPGSSPPVFQDHTPAP